MFNPCKQILVICGLSIYRFCVYHHQALSSIFIMDRLCETVFDWERIEQRYGTAQGPVNANEYNFHLKCVEMYYKYFHGTRIVADYPYHVRKRLHRALLICFIQRCFVIAYARYFYDDIDNNYYNEEALLGRFRIYSQFLPHLSPFNSYFL